MKSCSIEFTEECAEWLYGLNESEQVDVMAVIGLLKELGPQLKHPYSSGIEGSVYSHMRELRIQHKGNPYRILYAFDPARSAILLLGGNKKGDNRWYKKIIPKAEKLYRQHLENMTTRRK